MKRSSRYTGLLISFPILAIFAMGCSAEPQSYEPPDKETLAADFEYIHQIAKNRGDITSFRVDFSDDRQYRFVMNRFLAAGKNPGNSPQLFEEIEAKRERIRGNLSNGLMEAQQELDADTCAHALPLKETKAVGSSNVKSSSLVNCKGETIPYLYADLSTYTTSSDGTGYTDLGLMWGEVYDHQTEFWVDAPQYNIAANKNYNIDSMAYASGAGDPVAIFSFTNTQITGLKEPSLTMTHPKELYNSPTEASDDASPGEFFLGRTRFCIKRGGTDCDYASVNAAGQAWTTPLVGIGATKLPPTNPWTAAALWKPTDIHGAVLAFDPDNMYIPMKGTFDAGEGPSGTCKIKEFLDAKARFFLIDTAAGYTGMTCKIDEDKSAANLGSRLLQELRKGLVPEQSALRSFDFLGNFGKDCFGYQQRALLVVEIRALTTCGPRAVKWPGPPSVSNQVSPLDFKNSCVAEGTRIMRSDGTYTPIEQITSGDRIIGDRGGVPLTVLSTSQGLEGEPLVRLIDNHGHGLLITSKHPVATSSRGFVAADQIREGDEILTESGVTTITSAAREEYTGRVYNLTVGTTQELASFDNPEGHRTMFANGFLIGDNVTRADTNDPAEQMSVDPLSRLPKVWHRDYLNSLARR